MQPTTRKAISGSFLVAGIAGLAALGSIRTSVAPSADEPADVGVATPFVERTPFGTLELHTDPRGRLTVTLHEIGESPSVLELSPAKQDKCLVDIDGMGAFLDLSVVGGPNVIGLVDNGLGSRDQDNCNRSNGRLEPGQALAIELGDDPALEDVVFDYGVLDIEAKFGAGLRVETVSSTNGTQVATPPLPNASDNDADSGGSDNNDVPIGAAPATGETMGPDGDDFERLVIEPTSDDDRGEISLEGGGDYGAAADDHRTVFHLVRSTNYEYTLVCYSNGATVYDVNDDGTVKAVTETPIEPDWLVDVDPDGVADYPARARLFRYAGFETVEGVRVQKPCPDPIGADLSADGAGVLLEPSDDTAFLRVELTWIIPVDLVDLADGDPFARQIDLDGDGPGAPEDARFCEGFDGTTPFDPDLAGDVLHPADTPWCVIDDHRELTTIDGVDVVVQTMIWDGLGDPRWA